jgi:propionate CoA-transferase
VAEIAAEERVIDLVTLTAEPGVIGGIPAGGLNFGAAVNPQAVIDQPYQFDFYDGGGLDIAFLGLAQADREGNLNVSRFGPRLAGAGGFINISQSARELVFVGCFTAGDLQVTIGDGKLSILADGAGIKFVDQVQHRTFSGRKAARDGRPVLFITERCVFRLTASGLELIELAPGIDPERDIFAKMAFRPLISPALAPMDGRIFRPEPMGLRDDMLRIPIDQRISFDAARNILFVNFEHLTVKTRQDVEAIRHEVEKVLTPLGHRVNAVVNYDEFAMAPEIENDYLDMVRDLVGRFYSRVNRYSTSSFLRMKLGDALSKRGVAPHIYESAEEAEGDLS